MINTSIGLLGVAKQTNKSTAASEPTFCHGLTGGSLIKPERSVEQKGIACGLRANTSNSSYVKEVNVAIDCETMAYADALGLYAAATLGNCVSTSATESGYYKHVITLGSTIPYLTFWGQIGDTSQQTVQKAVGCKMDTLNLEFDGNDPLKVGLTAAGIDADLFGQWSGSTEPSCFDGYFIPTDGTFKFSPDSQLPTADVTITKGNFELSNSLTSYRGAGKVSPSEIAESKLQTNVKVTTIPDDFSIIRKVLTGSESGTKLAGKIVYGSAAWSFKHSQDDKCTLEVEFLNVPWTCETPQVSPDGNAAEVEFSADNIGVASKTGSPIKITLVNKVASYV
ncbi:MAG: hypothetical protein SPD80_02800 [Atopobium sp.]|uniref:phage tail tube protein n=1 Tax=Atopobium sp. TaxID=1872650 RepID=UPI002A82EC3F|nr:hypothetical protein [Atopobium sp.]MDY4522508.1 hypothetical protein [Atopobium sp.]